jgi:hypothetical protein
MDRTNSSNERFWLHPGEEPIRPASAVQETQQIADIST